MEMKVSERVYTQDYLRPLKRLRLEQYYDVFSHSDRSGDILELEGGIVVPPLLTGDTLGKLPCAVFTDGGELTDYSEDIADITPYQEALVDSKPAYRDESVIFCGYFNSHWGHFVVDVLSHLWYALTDEGKRYKKIVFAVKGLETPILSGNIAEAFRLCGLYDKIEFINRPTRYSRLIVPRQAFEPAEYFLHEALIVYETIAENAFELMHRDSWPSKVFMSRSSLPKAIASEFGLKWIDDFFVDNGYEIIYPEKLSLMELIGYMRHADEIAAVGGTLPHNLLFAPQGTRVVILEKYANINNYQPAIDVYKHLDVTYVDINAQIWSVNPGAGPFIMYPTEEFRQFAKDRGMKFEYEYTKSMQRRDLKHYFSMYRRLYNLRWELPEWLVSDAQLLVEAYRASYGVYAPWLNGEKLLFLSDLLSPRRVAKSIYHRIKK